MKCIFIYVFQTLHNSGQSCISISHLFSLFFYCVPNLHFCSLLVFFRNSVQFSSSVMSDSLQPHGRQPTRLCCPWDSPGKNAGVGCHCLLWRDSLFRHRLGAEAEQKGSSHGTHGEGPLIPSRPFMLPLKPQLGKDYTLKVLE